MDTFVDSSWYFLRYLDPKNEKEFSPLEKQMLVERHLISREHAARGAGSGLVLSRDESLCVMINEEDHLRMQSLKPGMQLREVWLAIAGLSIIFATAWASNPRLLSLSDPK